MEALACFGILLVLSGPIAVIMAIVLFNKISEVERRLKQVEFFGQAAAEPHPRPQAAAVAKPVITQKPSTQPSQQTPPPPPEKPAEAAGPIPPAPTVDIPAAKPVVPEVRVKQPSASPVTPPPKLESVIRKSETGLEQKIGVTAALVVGVIVLIVGVGFFLKYVYENSLFSDLARVSLVAVGGFASLIIGEVIRRRDYGIVAKGLAALGFSLLYAAIFSASRVYNLIDLSPALILALCVSAAAMVYAVCLDERFTAFLSLLGGYLSPLIIMYHQDMPVPVFSYVLALSMGSMLCAMFRRWRVVNWMALVGTWLLYTIWFEQFYAPSRIADPLIWLGVFGGLFLLQPNIHTWVRKTNSRVEEVSLVVINSVAVFYYLCRILYADYQQEMALAVAAFGAVHLVLMGAVLVRCRDDKKLPAALGVLGTALITTAIGIYFAEMPPKILAWAVEAIVLTFIGIRYKSLTTKAMSFLVAGVSVAGLFYHLPLHAAGEFRLVFNGPFGTWLFVAAALLICHTLWRLMSDVDDDQRSFSAQGFYVVATLLLALGAALEWYAWCDESIAAAAKMNAHFLMGMLVIASTLLALLVSRPLCPKGVFVQTVAAIVAVAGAVFTAMTVMGVYVTSFKLFINAPFAMALLFVGVLLWSACQARRNPEETDFSKQLPDVLFMMSLLLIGILITEQMYMFWYCRNEYLKPIANWQTLAWQYMTIAWVLYGLAMLFAGIYFKKGFIKTMGVIAGALSAFGLCYTLPLHKTGDFQFVFNLPFMTWVCVATGLLIGHGLWRFLPKVSKQEKWVGSQVYYVAGVLLLGLGCVLEWYAHCHWQISGVELAESIFLQGVIVLAAAVLLTLLIRSLPPKGPIVRGTGMVVGLVGAMYVAIAMAHVYNDAFRLFANGPFAIAMLFVAALLTAAAFIRNETVGRLNLSVTMVLTALLLVWGLLSEQIYQYFDCRNYYLTPMENWQFSAQMYMSLSWAIYAAVLLLIGFFCRAAGIRYLSLGIFTVLLAKINWDIQQLPTEYRITTFVTTGLVLVGVSILYQFLRKKGFFDTIQDKKTEQIKNNPVIPENPV